MKILIDARGATWYSGTGIGTYTSNLVKSMISLDNKDEFHLFWSGEKDNFFADKDIKLMMSSRRHQRFFENSYIPSYATKEHVDLYHVPQNGIGLNSRGNFLKVVTIHDLIPYILPETVGKNYLKNFLRDMPNVLDNADGILTVSEYSKKDILKFFPSFPEERIFVTPLAANNSFVPLDKEKCKNDVFNRFNFNKPFIMYIGGFSLRKNVRGLVDAFNEAFKNLNTEYNLLIVGSLRDEGLKLKDYAMSLPVKDNIIFTGFIEDEYLPILYNACDTFVYPSLYEGFGLPPLEAMSCGTAVITSNITSIPEVVHSSELLVNPHSNDELTLKLLDLLNNNNLRNDIAKSCYEKSKEFTWEKTAVSTIKAYDNILASGKKNL